MTLPWTIWFRPAALIIAALLASGVGGLIFSTIKERDLYLFEVDVTNEQPSRIQLFYDIGHGFTEADSSIQPLFAKPGPVRYGFIIPRGQIHALRLDPTGLTTTVTIAKPAIIDIRRRDVKKFTIDEFTPLNQVEIRRIDKDSISVTSTGYDPSLGISFTPALALGMSDRDAVKRMVFPVWIKVFVTCWLAAGLLEIVPRRFLLRLKQSAVSRPLMTIVYTSLLGVLIQCHPVIFFNKSFVSPDNGTFLLYDHAPTLPGYKSEVQENAQGSDVAALLHTALSYPSLQRKALFIDGELPLWNRYALGGLPLIGQGQSMFGSLLNFITIAGDSSAESWDIRFVLSRWLYGLGLGIATWMLTRHLGAASVVSFVSLFIGFFGFRLNHMAQLSVDVSPWILVGWAMLKDRQSARAALVLFLSNWEVMNSGTVKEAYMLCLCLNFAGVLLVWISDLSIREKLTRLAIATASGICLILISAPLWLVFLDSLSTGSTHYDRATVHQAPFWQILGFFEGMLYRRFHATEAHVLPAVNFMLFAGVVWTIVSAQETWKQKPCIAVSLAILPPAFIVFSTVPAAWLIEVPFINQIYHVHNTFSCPLLVLTSILAGFGFKVMWVAAHEPHWWRKLVEFTGIVLALFLVHYGSAGGYPGSLFYKALVVSVVLALLIGHIGLRSWARTKHLGVLFLGVGGAIFLTCWQNSQYIKSPADLYVFNPGVRADLVGHSDAVKHVDSLLVGEPWRPVGLGFNVFAGYSEMLRWESIYGVEPVRNTDFDLFCDTAGLKKKDWGDPALWHEDNLPIILPFQNLLNVRYYLSSHTEKPAEIKGLRWIASHDLDLYESPGVWSRAFYTDRYVTYDQTADLIALLRKNPDSRPFAALLSTATLPDLPPVAASDLGEHLVTPAHSYKLTTNRTTFTIEAARAGLAVLAENYLSTDFRAFLNGKPVPYIQVNQTCKGVVIPGAGTYTVQFEYYPRRLAFALKLMGAGLLMAITLLSTRVYMKGARVRQSEKLVGASL